MGEVIIQGPNDPECLTLGTGIFSTFLRFEYEKKKFSGISMELIKIFSSHLQFCYRIVYPRFTKFGIKQANGSFNGLVGQLVNGEFDFILPPIGVSYDRAQVVDFSSAIAIVPHSAIYKYPTFETDVLGFIKPFTVDVWLGISVMCVLMALVFGVIALINQRFPIIKNRNREAVQIRSKYIGHNRTFADSALLVVRTMLSQSITEKQSFILGLWLMVCLVIGSMYKGDLKSKLIAPKVFIPFKTFEDLVDNTYMPYYYTDGTLFKKVGMSSMPGSVMYRAAHRGLRSTNGTQTRQAVLDGTHAYILFQSSVFNNINFFYEKFGDCRTTALAGTILPISMGMAFPKKSIWKPKIDKLIIRLDEHGIIRKLFADSTMHVSKCLNPQKQKKTELKPMNLKDFYGIFALFLGALATACIFFAFEMLVFHL